MPEPQRLKMVAIGGGTGLATLLSGLRPYLSLGGAPEIELTAVVTVTDDGRSSGRLRREFDVLPPGDIRNCLLALADDAHPLTHLFRHRFPGDGPLGGHSLGNLALLALSQMSGDFLTAIEGARRLLGVEARILPATIAQVDLVARRGAVEVSGQVAIKSLAGKPLAGKGHGAPISQLALYPADARALPAVVQAILEADLITLGPGSLFTSVIANLLIKDIYQALLATRARKIYLCNVMTEFDETDGFSAVDHLRQVLAYAPALQFDAALFNSAPISEEMLARYAAERAVALTAPTIAPPDCAPTQFIALPLASESRAVRHDPARLAEAVLGFKF